jgi:hypothetical protein
MGRPLNVGALVLKCAVSQLCSSPPAQGCRPQLLMVLLLLLSRAWPAPSHPSGPPPVHALPPLRACLPDRPQSTCWVWILTA